MVAVDIFDENIVGRCLDTDALIAIGDFDIVEITVVGANEINAIRSTNIWAVNSQMVRLQVRNQVEH